MDEGGYDDLVSQHLGRAPTFTVIDLDDNQVQVVKNTSDHMGGVGKPPELVAKTGAKVVICSGVGAKAVDMLQSYGIQVFIDAKGTAREAVEMWREGKLRVASHDIACREHHH